MIFVELPCDSSTKKPERLMIIECSTRTKMNVDWGSMFALIYFGFAAHKLDLSDAHALLTKFPKCRWFYLLLIKMLPWM